MAAIAAMAPPYKRSMVTSPVPSSALRACLVIGALTGSAVVTLWMGLPRWAPELVLRGSPFLMPAAHAAIAHGFDVAAFAGRIRAWGPDAVPALRRCLRHHDVQMRRLAMAAIASGAASGGGLDPRLRRAVAEAAEQDDDREVRASARHALQAIPHADGSAVPPGSTLHPRPAARPGSDDSDDDGEEDD